MPVDAERLNRDIQAIARCTPPGAAGSDRPTFSAAWRAACDYCVAEAVRVGCRSWIDAAGNLHLRPTRLAAGERVWLAGSHLDSVPRGGDYDGVVGVVAALECLRAAHEDDTPIRLEAVVFAEEEGTTFGLGMLGSRGWVGSLDAAELAGLRDAAGMDYWQAGAPHGAVAARLADERLDPAAYAGFFEVHVEQGPGLWAAGQSVALVTGIAGRRQYLVTLDGMANHAGSTSMGDRRDALAGAAEVISAVEAIAARVGPRVVATVGRIRVIPNAVNVIPANAAFTVDVRAPTEGEITAADAAVREAVMVAAARRRLEAEIEQTEALPAVALDAGLAERVRTAAHEIGWVDLPETVSGALHDAAILAPRLPTVMLFVASRDGVSHNPAEFSRIDDIAAATRLLAATLRRPPP
jgi:allantoate deiminase